METSRDAKGDYVYGNGDDFFRETEEGIFLYTQKSGSWRFSAKVDLLDDGGENYTNPLHFSRALFAGAARIEKLPFKELIKFIDVPWCKGDLYLIEEPVYALMNQS